MKSLRSTTLVFVACLSILTVRCGDSPTGGGGTVDTTPPGLASVTAVDRNHLQVSFTEPVEDQTAEVSEFYRIVERAPLQAESASPGDPVPVNSAVLSEDDKTLVLTTSTPMQNVPYDLFVSGVEDVAGNRIVNEVSSSFTGSNTPDETSPVILWRSPLPNTTDVPIGQAVVVQFSESMDYSSVLSAFSWTSAAGAVAWQASSDNNARFAFAASEPLDRNTNYTVSLGAEARDWAGNPLASTTWAFRTTAQIDNTPPALVSSSPADGATHVPVTANLSMTFTEALQPYVEEVLVSPQTSDGVLAWSPDGRTFTFDPYDDLLADTQYSVLIPPGGVEDLSGNGSTEVIAVVFTTGSSIASGSFAGALGGDPGSSAASNPTGALIVAADRTPFAEGDFGIAGSGIAGSGGSYSVGQLPDGTYWPFAVMETNGDDRMNPELGDAFGVYGVDFASQTGEPDSLTILVGSDLAGIDFDLFDPVALSGSVVYEGSMYPECCYTFFVGVFDTTGFDPGNPIASTPLYGTEGGIPNYPEWYVNQFDHGLVPGTYYVGAYMDANFNSTPDAGDPMALYESAGVPIQVTLDHGSDVLGITLRLQDPVPGRAKSLRSAAWPTTKAVAESSMQQLFRRIAAVIEPHPRGPIGD